MENVADFLKDVVLTLNEDSDYIRGAKYYALAKPRNGFVPVVDREAMKNNADALRYYHGRVRVFETGYDEAAKDERYRACHEFVSLLRKHL
jgi:hypothetical protein